MPGGIHLAFVVTLGAGAAGLGAGAAARAVMGRPVTPVGAVIKDAAGRHAGTLRVDGAGHGRARITVSVSGLPAGYHGLHIHAKGVCDPRSKDPATGGPFFSAGGHFDLGSHAHPDHSGDLPPLLVGADGTGTASAVTDRFRVRQLLDGDGSAVIVHARPDNQANIPDRYRRADGTAGPDADTRKTGDAGGRIACGVVTPG